MEMKFFLAGAMLFLILFVSSDEWSSFDDDLSLENASDQITDIQKIPSEKVFKTQTRFTSEFYLAIILLVVSTLIVLYIIYSFFKKPKNKWEK